MFSSKHKKAFGSSVRRPLGSANDSVMGIGRQQESVQGNELRLKVEDIMARYQSSTKNSQLPVKPNIHKGFFKKSVTTETGMQTELNEVKRKSTKKYSREEEFIDFLKAVDLHTSSINAPNDSPKQKHQQLHKNLKYLQDLFKQCREPVLQRKDMNRPSISFATSNQSQDAIGEYRKMLEDELASSESGSCRKPLSDLENTLDSHDECLTLEAFSEGQILRTEKNEGDTIEFINGIYSKLFV
eukprot:TRINITY_DN8080_c0_g5_i2.p1 TRINITY_DN8080_c0_g5~~TRINITY_DN8080_c0_g5_i2.p1  ORF type:complete len:242 (-),score=48.86 TRINITY_DN8080_c0_g5_i2:1626-2351(-)